MSTKANPVVVGSFVLGALVLLVGALLVFGGGRLFEERRTFVSYFEGSLKGLRVGSNVLFRGVRVGFVRDIRVEVDEETGQFLVPVVFEILPESIAVVGPEETGLLRPGSRSEGLEALIGRGLRTRLETESFVTGQLVIELDFYPESPANFVGKMNDLPEIPSIPSNIQQVLERMREFVAEFQATVDVDALVSGVITTLEGIDGLVRSEDLHGALAALNRLSNLEELERIPASVLATLGELDDTLAEVRGLVDAADGRIGPLASRAEDSLDELSAVLREAGTLLERLTAEVSPESDLNFQLRRTLEESQAAARSLRQLADFLERHPETLLRGRRGPTE